MQQIHQTHTDSFLPPTHGLGSGLGLLLLILAALLLGCTASAHAGHDQPGPRGYEVEDDGRAGLTIRIEDRHGRADTSLLAQLTREHLRKIAPSYVEIDPRTRDDGGVLVAELGQSRMQVSTRLIESSRRTHLYGVTTMVPNRAIPTLERAEEVAVAGVVNLRDRLEETKAQRAAANARFRETGNPQDRKQVVALHDRAVRIQYQLNDAAERVAVARSNLARAPKMVAQVHEEAWPYRLETHQLTASLTAEAVLWADGLRVCPPAIARVALEEVDTAIDRANPKIGLHPKELCFTEPGALESALVDQAAAQLARDILNAALDYAGG